MSSSPPSEAGLEPLSYLSQHLDWFEAQLRDRRIHPPSGSALRSSLDALHELRRGVQDNDTPIPPPERVVDGICAAVFVGSIRQLADRAPSVLDQCWNIFRGQDVVLGREAGRTAERDRMWEIYCAAVASIAGDDPRLGLSDNPDVSFRIREEKWGIECKALYSQNPRTAIEAIKDKIKQVCEGKFDRGIVMVDLTPVIDHHRHETYGIPMEQAWQVLNDELEDAKNRILATGAIRQKLRDSWPKVAALVFVAHSAFLASDRPTFLKSLAIVTARRIDAPVERVWLNRLRLGVETVMTQGQQPYPHSTEVKGAGGLGE